MGRSEISSGMYVLQSELVLFWQKGVAGAMHYFCIALEFENGTSCASSSSLEAQPPLLAYPH
jgi:hypothetical protein